MAIPKWRLVYKQIINDTVVILCLYWRSYNCWQILCNYKHLKGPLTAYTSHYIITRHKTKSTISYEMLLWVEEIYMCLLCVLIHLVCMQHNLFPPQWNSCSWYKDSLLIVLGTQRSSPADTEDYTHTHGLTHAVRTTLDVSECKHRAARININYSTIYTHVQTGDPHACWI